MRIMIATIKSWNIEQANQFANENAQTEIKIISSKQELTPELVESFSPDYIFFPHWSWIIPAEIYENYHCVVFHMTDLPFGRGGSPLQNLLVRGIYQTKLSAIRVSKGLDTGDIYLKEPLDLSDGSAAEILQRCSELIFQKMIPRFLTEKPLPKPQQGKVVEFARRTPEQSELPQGLSLRQKYDYIRMLDGEGYPRAFVQTPAGKVYFSQAELKDGKLNAKAEFEE